MITSSSGTQPLVRNLTLIITAALLYSFILGLIAMFLAGIGDGSYVLCGIFSAPFSLFAYGLEFYFGMSLIGLICFAGIVALWTAAGTVAAITNLTIRRLCLGSLLFSHYISAPFVLRSEAYGNWIVFNEQWGHMHYKLIIMFSLIVYLLGQLWLWRQFLRKSSDIKT